MRIGRDAYAGAADTLLYYMRQQRSGWNPLFQTWVRTKDALIVDHPTRTGQYQPVMGGWADAADYLQYVATMAEYYKRGLQAVVDRAGNGFRVGVPFIWCSNNLMASFAMQALLFRQMTGDERFREYEVAALDWLLDQRADHGWDRKPRVPLRGDGDSRNCNHESLTPVVTDTP